MTYIFDTHYGKSSLADESTGMTIEWSNGDFENSCKVTNEGTVPDGKDRVLYLWLAELQMKQYVFDNYKELM